MRFDLFLASREETCGPSMQATYAAYIADVRRFLADRPGDDPFSPATIRAYLTSLKKRGLSDASIDNRYRAIKTCCRWLIEEELLDRDPFQGKGRVRPMPKKRQRRRVYTEAEVVALLKATSGQPPDWKQDRKTSRKQWQAGGPLEREAQQGRALVLLLVDSAMRAGEVCALDCGQVRTHTLIIRSKGGHQDVAFVTDATRTAVRELAGDRPDSDPLFRDWSGQRCSVRALRGIMQRLARRAGVELPPRPLHAFRHYAARQWLKAGLEDLIIRQLMRHEQLSTARIYTELEPDDLAEKHASASPIARLLDLAG